ncbi:hypothetical protein HQ654_08710 [Enterococcus faecium]|nr:hypothetical protein [Enterococcus faecium]
MERFLDYTFAPEVNKTINSAKVTDHHAILPTKQVFGIDWGSLSRKSQNLLSMVCMQVLKAVCEDQLYDETLLDVICNGHQFHAKGKQVQQMGFK